MAPQTSLSVDQAYTDDQAFHSPNPNEISVDQAYAGKQKAEGEFSIGKVVAALAKPFTETGHQYWGEYTREEASARAQLKADVKPGIEEHMSLVGRALHGLKTGMDVGSWLWTPASSFVQAFGVNPSNAALDKVGEQIKKHVPETSKNPSDVTKKDVDFTIKSLQQFNEIGQQTAAGMLGVGEIPREEGIPPVRPEPEEIGGKPKPHVQITGVDAATGKPRVRLATPEQASARVAQTMTKAHQEMMGDVVDIRNRTRAQLDKLEKEIEDASHQYMDLTHRRHELRVTPEQAELRKSFLRKKLDSLEAQAKPLRAKIDLGPEGWEYVRGEVGLSRTHPLWTDWHELNAKMASRYEQARQGGTPIGAHTVLDTMIQNAGTYTKPFLAKLRQHVQNVPIHFVDVVRDTDGKAQDWSGVYTWYDDPAKDHIQVKVSPDSAATSRVIGHELVHAATSRFIADNPRHPLVRELEELYEHTRKLTKPSRVKLKPENDRLFYGEANIQEFVAEAMSNPRFQEFLTTFKIAGRSAWTGLSSIVRRMLGLHPGTEENLLHSVMKTTSQIMQEQSRQARGVSSGVAAMTVESAKEAVQKSTAVRKLSGYVDELQRAVAPESLGPEAKTAGAVIASRISERMSRTETWRVGSEPRVKWWNQNPELTRQFLKGLETGKPFENPDLEALRQTYKTWSDGIYQHETKHLGLQYTPRDNYIMHVFNDAPGLEQHLNKKFGKKWANPRFIKDRVFDLYEEAIKAGFKPKYSNPEEIMLARQMSSDLVDMQVNILRDLSKYGLAIEKRPGMKLKPGVPGTTWRSPTGQWYFVHEGAEQVLQNAFLSRSLWSQPGAVGDAFRASMGLKNAIVGPRLAFSLFHAFHVIHIDNMDAASIALGDALAGKRSAISTLGELVKSGMLLPRSLWENPRAGSRLVKVWGGKIKPGELTDTDAQNLQFMLEGGFVPRLSDVYRVSAARSFRKALGEHSATALWHLPGAVLSTLQKPIFEVWIPNLKAASYMRSVESALARDPELLENSQKRQLAFRKIAKSVDNRYGEMSYNTLFWKRWIKDLSTLNTLSLGWQLGFIREYGGGALDLGQFVKGSDKIQAIREGKLDRPLFVATYTATALGYGGLLTWAMTGESPKNFMDYMYPRVGGQNGDGSPKRVNTMFYTREFGDLYFHMRNEGIVSGLSDLVTSKSSGLFGLIGEWAKGVNDYGQEIRDPNAPAYKQVEQTLASTLKDLEPISLKASGVSEKQTALGIAGFNPVPQYVQETRTEARVKAAYLRYEKGAVEPYDKAQESPEYAKLRQQYQNNDPGFYDTVDELETKYGVTRIQVSRMLQDMRKGISPSVSMFSRITDWKVQKALLDQMTPEEREVYLPHSNRAHLRRHYEAPSD